MIKFFRHIRQQLIQENKTSPNDSVGRVGKPTSTKASAGKYFKYAIGEIILVVIGILIALQINNWNELRKERKKEQAFLKEINLDFKSNKSQLDSIIQFNKGNLHAAKRLSAIIKTFDPKNPVRDERNSHLADSLAIYNRLVWRNKSFNPKNGTVEALLNSSSFDLISNDTLRRNLIAWKDVLGDYLEEEQFASDFLFKEYGPWARASFDPDATNDPENVTAFFSKKHRNYINQRIGDLSNNLKTVEEESVLKMIDEIIRLTANSTE